MGFVRVLTATLFCLGQLCTAQAQTQYKFRHLGVEDGLSHSWINAIYEDEFNMIWIGTRDGLNRFDGRNITVFRPEAGDSTSLYSNNVKSICGDGRGTIYLISKFALSRFDMRTERFSNIAKSGIMAITVGASGAWAASNKTVYRIVADTLQEFVKLSHRGNITALMEDSAGQLFVGTSQSGAFVYDGNKKERSVLPSEHVVDFYQDSKKNIFITTRNNGMFKLSFNETVTHYLAGLSNSYVRSVIEDNYGNYWIGTINGVDVLSSQDNTITPIASSSKEFDVMHSPHPSTWCMICDKRGAIWIGSSYGGLSIYNSQTNIYRMHYGYLNNSQVAVINDVARDGDGLLWVASEEQGIIRYNPTTSTTHGNILPNANVKGLLYDPLHKCVWATTIFSGLFKIDAASGRVMQSFSWNAPGSADNNIRKVVKLNDDTLILATYRNATYFNIRTGQAMPVFDDGSPYDKYITDIFVDSHGFCWMSFSDMVVRYDPRTGKCKKYLDDPAVIGSFHIITIFEDSKKRLWFGSSGGGLYLYRPQSNDFAVYNTRNSMLSHDYILDLDESDSGYLLMITNGGFTRFDPESSNFYNYNRDNGFPVNEPTAYGLHKFGERIYVCGYRSLVSFSEVNLVKEQPSSEMCFTTLYVNNRRVGVGDETGILDNSLFYQKRIVLDHHHTVFSVEFSSPTYLNAMSGRTEYMLEGFNTEWVQDARSGHITYTNIAPGDYDLKVRFVDAATGKVLAQDILEIVVRPPFFKTLWFALLMLILFGALFLWLSRFYFQRLRLENSLQFEKREKEHIQLLNESKLRFFTYVSHELRTPLSLIHGYVERLLQSRDLSPTGYQNITRIDNNLGKINLLVNELLDFKKQESGFMEVNFSPHNIVDMLGNVYAAFKWHAVSNGIDLVFDTQVETQQVWYEAPQLEKVFYNLLSNAFKFTHQGGRIILSLTCNNDTAIISVADTGVGIPADELEYIFNPFHQIHGVNSRELGTGLGLTIAMGIVNAHYGELSVQSQPRKGSVFTVRLPLGNEHIPHRQIMDAVTDDRRCIEINDSVDSKFVEYIVASRAELTDQQPVMMIVEDNVELREFLVELFSPIYNVVSAEDGVQAWEMIQNCEPDIVLSDLMMPCMDGNELCNHIKSNADTCHIPFVILTAKVDVDATLEGYKAGADDYVPKPFNSKILITKCNNMLNSRYLMQRRFIASPTARASVVARNLMDEKLLNKAMGIVKANLTNHQFELSLFASEMAMGRTKLFVKIKKLTGQTPNQFISNIKLKMAVEYLMDDTSLSINDVAQMAGFNSLSYFIKSFRQLYGITPMKFQKEIVAGNNPLSERFERG